MKKLFLSLAVLVVSAFTFVTPASANHSWSSYHWARTNNPFTLQLGDNLTSNWKSVLTTAWKNLVICQEVGHNFGLDHQDESFDNTNLGTCMDYMSNPESNQHPNAHDYQQLESIYAHLDSMTTVSSTLTTLSHGQDVGKDPSAWGQLVRRSERRAVYERDFGNGQKLLTHVFYAN